MKHEILDGGRSYGLVLAGIMHFEDLSLYTYGLSKPIEGVRNIGWLCKDIAYPTGGTMPHLVEALKRWAIVAEVNQMRGFEQCKLCPVLRGNNPGEILAGYMQTSTSWNNEKLWLGASEIWIPDGQGGIFAAPSLIIHYVETHYYQPPMEFVEAALRPPPKGWDPNREWGQRTNKIVIPSVRTP